jgi:ABC-type hemin transport system substrate-binding protein
MMRLITLLLLIFSSLHCNRGNSPGPASSAKPPTVASLVPSATDLIVSMGAADHLVAVDNYNHDPRTANLPHVGDYESVDWEKLSQIRPNVIITFHSAGNGQSGFAQKAEALGIREANIRFDRLPDIYDGIKTLGTICNEPTKADAEVNRIRNGLNAVRERVGGLAPVKALIVTEMSGVDFAGRDNFLDDLLQLAGGENAITTHGFVRLDREAIEALRPQVILQLMPGADPAKLAENRRFWDSFADLPAVRDHRVWQFTENYIMEPGSHVTDTAQKFAAALHPPQTAPATRATP